MKNLFIGKYLVIALCLLSVQSLIAKDIYLSVNGVDTNNGLSESGAVATLAKALSLIEDGDNIRVSGIIDVSKEVSGIEGVAIPQMAFSIIGDSPSTSGFTGNGVTRIFNIDSNDKETQYKNLSFINGAQNQTKGSAVFIQNSRSVFTNCIFKNNIAVSCKGTVYLYTPNQVEFYDCIFTDNQVQQGGAVFSEMRGKLVMDRCMITNCNLQSVANSNGGGLQILGIESFVLKNSTVRNCSVAQRGGGINIENNINTNEIVRSSIRIENSLLAENNATDAGGAIAIKNALSDNIMDMQIINCTIWKNYVKTQGGAALYIPSAQKGSSVSIVNCTITENTASGNRGFGCGLCFWKENDNTSTQLLAKRIYNSIVESNMTDPQGQSSDMGFRYTPVEGEDLFISNSYLGFGVQTGAPLKLETGNENVLGYELSRLSGLVSSTEEYVNRQNSIPLFPNCDALTAGKASFLQDLGINTDQIGNIRSFENGTCAVGAVEMAATLDPGKIDGSYQHIIMYGQSLSTGHQSWPVISTENVPGNFMIGDQVWINYGNKNFDEIKPLIGNVSAAFANNSNIRNRNAGTIAECPLLGAVNHIQKKLQPGTNILATSAGTSGTSIEELSKENEFSTCFSQFSNTLLQGSKLAFENNKSISCPVIFFMQGEYNYTSYENKGMTVGSYSTTDGKLYYKYLLQLKNNMQDAVKKYYGQDDAPLFITYQTGAQYTRGTTLEVGMAQLNASNENEDIVCAGPVYPMTDRGGHLDSNGYRWYGEMLGKVYYKTCILKEDFKPLQPIEITRNPENANEISIRFIVPKLPLVFDSKLVESQKNLGFVLSNNSVEQTITNIQIKDDCVVLTSASPLTGNVEVSYATQKTNGHGNLRDSDDYEAFFNYIDLDKKVNGEYVYPRDENETTLRPNYEPRDENFKIIYDQPYPLYNFSVAFYYKIPQGENIYKVPSLSAVNKVTENMPLIYQNGNNLIVQLPNNEKGTAMIFNMYGQNLKSVILDENKTSIPVASLDKKIYIVKILTKNGSITQKVQIR